MDYETMRQIDALYQQKARFLLTDPNTGEMYPDKDVVRIVADLIQHSASLVRTVSDLEQQLETTDLHMALMAQESERESARLQAELDHIAHLRRGQGE